LEATGVDAEEETDGEGGGAEGDEEEGSGCCDVIFEVSAAMGSSFVRLADLGTGLGPASQKRRLQEITASHEICSPTLKEAGKGAADEMHPE